MRSSGLLTGTLAAVCAAAMLLGGCSGSDNSNKENSKADTTVTDSSSTAQVSETAVQTTESAKIDNGGLSNEDGFMVYRVDGQPASVTGIDVSSFCGDIDVDGQPASVTGIDVSSFCGDIDWQRVKNAGVTFVMVRLGGRGYGDEGALYSDDRAVEYISGAQAAGIHTGGYFFSQATNADEAKEEARYCQELLGDLRLDYPLAYDLEFIENDTARTDGMTVEQTTDCARAFCDEAKALGYEPMLYFSESSEPSAKYDLNKLSDCELWFSEYSDAPTFPYNFGMWQYSNTATVDGVENNVDLNLRIVR